MQFYSTRNKKNIVNGAEAICQGISGEGGLFVPAAFPQISREQTESFCDQTYEQTAAQIVGAFLPELGALPEYTAKAYAKFDGDPAPVVKVADDTFVMELWHGPTHAFKD
ncbi:MAG: threonine synthase, partial [Clostridiales bacterium]|nr:threonine synthase [Clostridiales bacterium]